MDRVALRVEANLVLAHHVVVLRAGFVALAVRATEEAKPRVGFLHHHIHHVRRALAALGHHALLEPQLVARNGHEHLVRLFGRARRAVSASGLEVRGVVRLVPHHGDVLAQGQALLDELLHLPVLSHRLDVGHEVVVVGLELLHEACPRALVRDPLVRVHGIARCARLAAQLQLPSHPRELTNATSRIGASRLTLSAGGFRFGGIFTATGRE